MIFVPKFPWTQGVHAPTLPQGVRAPILHIFSVIMIFVGGFVWETVEPPTYTCKSPSGVNPPQKVILPREFDFLAEFARIVIVAIEQREQHNGDTHAQELSHDSDWRNCEVGKLQSAS
jgi:hypothetical protein